MTRNKILLARPNSFIIKHMKKFVSDLNCEALPIHDLAELQHISLQTVRAAVISTAVSSVVKEDYPEVIQLIRKNFPNRPIFLASMVDTAVLRRSVDQKFVKIGESPELITLSKAAPGTFTNARKQALVIRKNDLTNEITYGETLKNARQIIGSVRTE